MRFGLYLSLIFLSIALADKLPILSLLGPIMVLMLPVVLYRSLRRTHVANGYGCGFFELWVQGIATFLFASAICGLVTMVYMKWVAPGFLVAQVEQAIESCKAGGTHQELEMARIMGNMIRQGVVPSPSNFVISMFWLTMALGSVLSLVMAALSRIGKKINNPTIS
ncbi:MAG: DUF4199 domain-containing protein [Bacteroides sp.]|nr:DUF4199 domain-containing protein [Bacteroides sp.]MCM1471614.1 DUF4199 domain-containing protein [Bacteroides sp.]